MFYNIGPSTFHQNGNIIQPKTFFVDENQLISLGTIDIERKNRLLKVCYVPTTSAT
jgi:hypothetical protein